MAARYLAAGPVHFALAGAAYLNEPEWIDLLAGTVTPDENGAVVGHLLDATRAFFAKDQAVCGRALLTYYELLLAKRFGAPPAALVLARELQRSGVRLGPEWEPVFHLLRQWFERAGAAWYLSELDTIIQNR